MNKTDVFYKQVGENIRSKRKERNLSQDALARAVGLKRPSMSNIEKGRQNILLHTFCDIVETLGTNAEALFPCRIAPTPADISDLASLSQPVREFVQAAINPVKGEKGDGNPKTKNRVSD